MFEEIKQSCQEKSSNVTSVIDDIHGAKNISDHFKTVYEQLYNEQGETSDTFVEEINCKVAEGSFSL